MANAAVIRPAEPGLYDQDFYDWTQEQARALRERRFADLDIENIAEELETLGRSDKREIRSRVCVILVHLLKWRYQPAGLSSSWNGTLMEQRDELRRVLEDSPSLRRLPEQSLTSEFERARRKAAMETGLSPETFPNTCPFSVEDVLSDHLPD